MTMLFGVLYSEMDQSDWKNTVDKSIGLTGRVRPNVSKESDLKSEKRKTKPVVSSVSLISEFWILKEEKESSRVEHVAGMDGSDASARNYRRNALRYGKCSVLHSQSRSWPGTVLLLDPIPNSKKFMWIWLWKFWSWICGSRSTSATTCGMWPWKEGTRSSSSRPLLLLIISPSFAVLVHLLLLLIRLWKLLDLDPFTRNYCPFLIVGILFLCFDGP